MDNVKIINISTIDFDSIPLKSELKRLSDKHDIGLSEVQIAEILSCRAETDINKLSELFRHLTIEYVDLSISITILNLYNFERYSYCFLNGKCHILHY
jgi:hypothetical protein|nr:MAG TPA: hypothetical protein [Caudoviricetes sp.]